MYSIGEGAIGSSLPSLSTGEGKEEPSLREEWMEKIGDIRFDMISRFDIHKW